MPVAPRYGTNNPEWRGPRQWQYPFGWNQNRPPRSELTDLTPFDSLRNLARLYDVAAMCIGARLEELQGLEHNFAAKKRNEEAALLDVIEAAEEFWEMPDGSNDFASWVVMAMRDYFEIDAMTMFPRNDLGGRLLRVESVDGSTIKPILNDVGATVGYQQVIHGYPASQYDRPDDVGSINWYAPNELLYMPRWLRTDSPYGFPPTEWIILRVNTALRKQVLDLRHFTNGNIPEMIAMPDKGTILQPDQVEEFQEWFNSVVEGNPSEQVKIKFLAWFAELKELRPFSYDTKLDSWMLHVTCAAYSVPPSELGFLDDVNRSTGDLQEAVNERRGLRSSAHWLKQKIERITHRLDTSRIGSVISLPGTPTHPIINPFKRIKWDWRYGDVEDQSKVAQSDHIYMSDQVITPSEIRSLRFPTLGPRATGDTSTVGATGQALPKTNDGTPAPMAVTTPRPPTPDAPVAALDDDLDFRKLESYVEDGTIEFDSDEYELLEKLYAADDLESAENMMLEKLGTAAGVRAEWESRSHSGDGHPKTAEGRHEAAEAHGEKHGGGEHHGEGPKLQGPHWKTEHSKPGGGGGGGGGAAAKPKTGGGKGGGAAKPKADKPKAPPKAGKPPTPPKPPAPPKPKEPPKVKPPANPKPNTPEQIKAITGENAKRKKAGKQPLTKDQEQLFLLVDTQNAARVKAGLKPMSPAETKTWLGTDQYATLMKLSVAHIADGLRKMEPSDLGKDEPLGTPAEPIEKGDSAGHEFHGNQWTNGGGHQDQPMAAGDKIRVYEEPTDHQLKQRFEQARSFAEDAGVDGRKYVRYDPNGYKFTLNGRACEAAAIYSPKSKQIQLYDSALKGTTGLRGIVEHECTHLKFHKVEEWGNTALKYQKQANPEEFDGRKPKKEFEEQYNIVRVMRAQAPTAEGRAYRDQLGKTDGVTAYSREYWKQYDDAKRTGTTDRYPSMPGMRVTPKILDEIQTNAVNETLAEISYLRSYNNDDSVPDDWQVLLNSLNTSYRECLAATDQWYHG